MQEHHLAVTRTARYVTIGEWSENTKQVWFALHGYGQLAEYFIKKFEILDDDQTLVVAPEALSRFYLQNFGGRVGATWMTREQRTQEITDYVNYLNQLYDAVLADKDLQNVQINILGFSQGTATALRWINDGHVRCDRLVLWAGYFANGIADVISPEKLTSITTYLAYGTKDEFLVEIDLNKYETDIRTAIPHVQIKAFDGKHTIDSQVLKQIADEP